ncbi:MAG TPA: alpha/beta hydrolase [Hyphomicrobiaceae bacterium]|nr:alpha/beta hydrolase [Hyphomicrobiaceae bacterium]
MPAAGAGVLAAVLVLAAVAGTGARGGDAAPYGPFGPQGPRMREQLWIVPSADPAAPLRATVFRPSDGQDGGAPKRRPLVVINHGTSEQTRYSTAMPVFYWLSRWFVERGFVVLLPQRRGHGATGGTLIEAVGDCGSPDHHASGLLAAADIEAAVGFMAEQEFIARDDIVVAGISTGGWASLALSSRNPRGVRAVVNFAGGRGAHAYGRRNAVCGEDNLVEAAGRFGKTARTPALWLYSENDSYFGPGLARRMHAAWTEAGGKGDIAILPPLGAEGHGLVDDQSGWRLWGTTLEGFLARNAAPKPRIEEAKAGDTPSAGFLSSALKWVGRPDTASTGAAAR